jgi:hypothetical protein
VLDVFELQVGSGAGLAQRQRVLKRRLAHVGADALLSARDFGVDVHRFRSRYC